MDNNEMIRVAGEIIDVFEDFLDEKGIEIKNIEKEDAIAQGEFPDEVANIYGSDYYQLEDTLKTILARI